MGTIKERGAAEAAPQGLKEERCPQPMSSPGLHVFADFRFAASRPLLTGEEDFLGGDPSGLAPFR